MFLRGRTTGPGDESGSALIAVIGLLAVTGIIGATLVATTIFSSGFTAATRADVQSVAAAEAGIDDVVAALRSGTPCAGTGAFSRAAVPTYDALLYTRTATGAYAQGCPGATTAFVKIVSIGRAQATGVTGQTRGDTSTMEAEFSYSPVVLPAGGGAVYSYSVPVLNNASILSDGGAIGADVMIHDGSVTCQGNTLVQGDLFVRSGDVNMSASCRIDGDVHASGALRMNTGSTRIGGNAIAATTAGVAADLSPDARIAGNLVAGGTLNTWGSVDWSNPNRQAAFANAMRNAGTVSGSVSWQVAGLSAPTVDPWVDVQYRPSDWTGFVVYTYTGSCMMDQNNHQLTDLMSTWTTPRIVDARNCATLTFSNSYNHVATLKTSVAIFGRGFSVDVLRLKAAAGATPKFWLIVPDGNPGVGGPQCTGSGGIALNNTSTIEPGVAAFFYTPCTIDNNLSGLRGQLYGGTVAFHSTNPTLTYVSVGIPGVNFGGGSPSPAPAGATFTLLSKRDI